MPRTKRWWMLKTFGLGGVSTTPDRVYVVTQSFTLVDDPERVLYHEMGSAEARDKAQALLRAADEVDRLNSKI